MYPFVHQIFIEILSCSSSVPDAGHTKVNKTDTVSAPRILAGGETDITNSSIISGSNKHKSHKGKEKTVRG